MDEKIYTGCFGKLDVWENKAEAIKFYKYCAFASEGSEHERYSNIVLDLLDNNSKIGIDDWNCSFDNYEISDIYIRNNEEKIEHIIFPNDIKYKTSLIDAINMYKNVNYENVTWEEEFEKQRNIIFYQDTSVDKLLDYPLEDDTKLTGGLSFEGETVRDFIESQKQLSNKYNIDNILELNRRLNICGIKMITRQDYEKYMSKNNEK